MSEIIPIYDPGKGVFTAADQDDLPPGFANVLENFYLDRPGKIRKREGVLAYGSNFPASSYLRNLFRFVHKDLTGGATTRWLSLWRYSTATGKIYVSNAAGSAWTLVEDIGTIAAGDEMRALVIGIVLRMAFSRSISPVWYGYLKRKFFHDLWDYSHTTPVWYDDDITPRYPTTWGYTSLTALTPATGGELGVGHHFYKAVPVFDGGQIALFAEGKAHYEIESGTTNILLLRMGFSDADWNPRITHINIYRQINPDAQNDDDALYRLVSIISTQNTDPATAASGDTMEKKWYDRDKSWGVNDWVPVGTDPLNAPENGDIKYTVLAGDTVEGDILSNTANILTLNDNYLGSAYHSYVIKKYQYNGSWSFVENSETGINGWGGTRGYYVTAASYEDSEFQNFIILEQSNYRLIIENNNKVLILNVITAVGTGVSLKFAKYLWSYSTPDATLRFLDYGLLDKGSHPLAGVTSIEAYYKYHAYFKGRLYGLNLAFDPSGDNEQYPDWTCFSEIDQPDVIPNTNFIMPSSGRGGEGMGIFDLENADALVAFFRHDITFLQVPRADPTAWRKHDHPSDIGLINDAAVVRTPRGYFFCYDTGIYFMGMDGRIKEIPVSFPIDDIYRAAVAAGSGSSFSAMYLSERRIVLFGLGTNTQAWALEIDSVFGDYPKWFKFPFGTVSAVQVKPERSGIDENGYFYLHEWEGQAIYRMNEALTGTEVFGTRLGTAYIHPGTMEREPIIRYARVKHKGSDAITPKVYLNEGAKSETLTVIAAAANGEEKVISIKRRGRNVALELASAASANIDHEIHGIELEVGK